MKQSLLIRPLPYFSDSAVMFERIADFPGAVFLDSGYPHSSSGRFDIFTAFPRVTISSHNGVIRVSSADEVSISENTDPFAVIKEHLEPLEIVRPYPFLTGAIGYFSYDLGRYTETLPKIAADPQGLPEMLVGIYDWVVVVDHASRHTALLSLQGAQMCDEFKELHARLLDLDGRYSFRLFKAVGETVSNMSKAEYFEKWQKVMDYIRAGDCYQVNLAQRFSVPTEGSSWLAYRRLRQLNPTPFSAYLNCGDFQVLSISPEKFLGVRNNHVETRPIKGTRPRRQSEKLDRKEIEDLKNSGKDRAENLMIVDLLRNDLSKNCRLGSVRVSRLFDIESYANVHHLVSIIEADLEADRSVLDLLAGCFPGGSITGAPKLRAMEIIEELEPHRRGVYCGAIGYISRHGDMDLNIAIRTAVCCDDQFIFYGGGGLVADSSAEVEYQETLDKVSSMFDLLRVN